MPTLTPISRSKPLHRNRLWYALSIPLVIATGLVWRSHLLSIPKFLTKYGGDSLWALVVFLGFALLFNRASTLKLAAISLSFAWLVEFSQLYHAPWIDFIRSYRIGTLILGSTFNWPDLLSYAVGVGLGVVGELIFHRRSRSFPS